MKPDVVGTSVAWRKFNKRGRWNKDSLAGRAKSGGDPNWKFAVASIP